MLLLSHDTVFCISLVIHSVVFSSNSSRRSLINSLNPPPQHPMMAAITFTLYPCLLFLATRNAVDIFGSFQFFFTLVSFRWACHIPKIKMSFFLSSSNIKSGLQALPLVRIMCSQYRNIFFLSFSMRCLFSHLLWHHLVFSGNNPSFFALFTTMIFSALSCLLTYSVAANFLQPDKRCCKGFLLFTTQSANVLLVIVIGPSGVQFRE